MSKLRTLLAQAHIQYREIGTNVGHNFINICCPVCGESLFHCGINEEEFWWKCLVCSKGGQWYELATILRNRYPRVDWFSLNTKKGVSHYVDTPLRLRKDLTTLTRPLTNADELQWDYLTQFPYDEELHSKYRPRGLPESLVQKLNIGVGIGKLSGYVTFQQGENLIARAYLPDRPRWWKSINEDIMIYGEDQMKEVRPSWAVITEGVFDVLALPYGHGLAILGSIMSDNWLGKTVSILPKSVQHVILALDRGVGQKTRDKFILLLSDCGYTVLTWEWDRPELYDIKDLDETRIILSHMWVQHECEKLVGLRGIEDKREAGSLLLF